MTPSPVRVRMGLHVGEVRIRDDGRYVGRAFNRCARIRALGHGGQTLLSRTMHDLVIDSGLEGVQFIDVGQHRLRDLARPEVVYQLTDPDDPATFPPLRSLSSVPHNLPVQVTSFVGREAEMVELGRLLGSARMITVAGAGGCGKTRFVLEAAADLVEHNPDGLWWVDLAPVSEPSQVASTVAAVTGARVGPFDSVADALVDHLRHSHALLVVDNCEHLIEACAALCSALLTACPSVRVLATSRERLGIDGEVTMALPSLAAPPPEARSVAAVEASPAVELFVERAVSARPNFALTAENAARVADICRRLDGIPLAIELAAARVRMLSPADIAAGLADRFHLLVGGTRTALPRQRTLEASVDWSYELLSPAEQAVFRRLSVFPGSFDLTAAERVSAEEPVDAYEVLDLLAGLVDKSLVEVDETDSSARHRMLETVRVYGRQRLADAGESAAARDRHLGHFVELAERAAASFRGSQQGHWKRQLDLELDSLRAAMEHALTSGAVEAHLRIHGSMFDYWNLSGRYEEARASLGRALEATSSAPAHLRARALTTAAWVSFMAGTWTAASGFAAEAIPLAQDAGQEETLAMALFVRGWSAFFMGQGGIDDVERAHSLAEHSGPDVLRRQLRMARGAIRAWGSDPSGGHAELEAAMAEAAAADDLWLLGGAAYLALTPRFLAGHFDDAERVGRTSLDANRRIGATPFEAMTLAVLACISAFRGDDQSAEALLAEAVDVMGEVGGALATMLGPIQGFLALAAGDLDATDEAISTSLSVWRGLQFQLWIALSLWGLGVAALGRSDRVSARQLLTESLAAATIGDHALVANLALRELARLERAEGDLERAEDLAQRALREARDIDSVWGIADSLDVLAGIAAELGSADEAARLWGASERVRHDAGCRRLPVHDIGQAADVAAARARVGDDQLAGCWAEGTALSTDEAVTYAMRGRGHRRRPTAGWASLTPTEERVVELVAEGRSNPEIAEQIFVTRNTVKTHLKHIFAKLAITSRAELAAAATRRAVRRTNHPAE